MNEQTPIEETTPAPSKKRFKLWLLGLPLLACVACAALSIYALMPLRGKILDRFSERTIPVTGAESPLPQNSPLPDQNAKPDGNATPTPGAKPGSDPSAAGYRQALDRRLNICTVSFHAFLMLEQAAIDQPDLLSSSGWRGQAKDVASSFHDDCQAIGALPDAPAVYAEVDQLLKKAAAEVQPATDDFTALLETSGKGNQSLDKARSSLLHVRNFIHFTQHAEDVLTNLDSMKQI